MGQAVNVRTMSSTRRGFLHRAAFAAATTVGLPRLAQAVEAASPSQAPMAGARPRHIIHMVSDGMSMGTLSLSDQFSRLSRQRGLKWLELGHRAEVSFGWVNMRSLNSLVTDSAAASSSWGSGSRVKNGTINQLPDGRDLKPLLVVLGQAGWKRGLVTTTEITHATPAGFAGNASSRQTSETLAAQYLERGIEVLCGGGRKYFDPTQRKDKRDLRSEFKASGYEVMDEAGMLAKASLDRPWLGTFASGHLPFEIDRLQDKKLVHQVPPLAEMTRSALAKLERENQFILQVEGGRVDHGCHDCDIATAVREQVAFDEAIEVCLDFQRRVSDTLIIVTTDHSTANPGLNGTGDEYAQSSPIFHNILNSRQSLDVLLGRLEKVSEAAAVKKLIGEVTSYRVPDKKAAAFLEFLNKKGATVYDQMNSKTVQLGQLLANHLGVGWTSGQHTSDYVPLIALGPGAERFRGFMQNTQIFPNYMALAGVDFRNPEVPLLAECGPSAWEAERTGVYS